MNKKLLVMVMVPVLVVMSGALAFSAFSGTITTNVSASAGYISFNQQAWLYNSTQSNTYLTIDDTQYTSSVTSPVDLGWAGLDSLQGNTTTQTVSVSNMAPGNWVTFEFKVTNNGSVGFELSSSTATVKVTPSSHAPTGTVDSNSATSWSAFKGDMASDDGYVYMVTSIPSGSIDNGGYAIYYVAVGLSSGSGNAYQESTFSLSITINVDSDA